jgi:beta-lactamase class C
MIKQKSKTNRSKIFLGVLSLIMLCAFLIHQVQRPPESVPRVKVVLPEKIEPNPFVENLLTEYENTIRGLMARTQTPGLAIAIVYDTTVIYMKGFGVREVGKPDSVDIHSIFRLASVSKCFAPVLTGLLVQDGQLSWNDPVIRYLPDFALKSQENTGLLTIKHVLSHTTGLPYHTYTNLVEEGMELKAMLALLKDVKLTSKPGEIYSYQNVAYSLIAEVIQSATGKKYEALMAERVFKPLGMKDASMSYEDILLNKNVAHPHLMWRKGWRVTSINDTYYNVAPAGGVNASISDMAQLMKGLMGSGDHFIHERTLDEIFTPAVKAKSKNRNFRRWLEPANAYYAMGWRVLNFKHDTLMYHGGYINGYRSELAINRKNKIGICVLSNAPGNLVDNSIPYFFRLYFNQRDSILQWEKDQARKKAEPGYTKR